VVGKLARALAGPVTVTGGRPQGGGVCGEGGGVVAYAYTEYLTNEGDLNMTQRKIVQTTDPYRIEEVTETDGRIHWEIFGPDGFLSDHVSLADAESGIIKITAVKYAGREGAIESSPPPSGNRPGDDS